jgi:hypothetical protein
MFTFNGSADKVVNITPSAIGAAASSHTHDDRYYTETEADSKYVSKTNTGVQSIAGGLVIGGTSATATGKGRIMITGNVNPLIGI